MCSSDLKGLLDRRVRGIVRWWRLWIALSGHRVLTAFLMGSKFCSVALSHFNSLNNGALWRERYWVVCPSRRLPLMLQA